ncbi:MAG: glycoside hydrolase family 30 beta sandwich domain-containing protein [Lentimicrobiaceae bacterium]|jgi:glucosylceramidase|nr:glycoside hydrolase family 30 beta sandwich domain-containing protein [Lentimicrobiaceae bacterium]MDD4598756.1 glycoside hydrolase family 30 beta sandwich domain-containing protein [Lentimicrobiaceae bacterium]
MKRPDSSLFVLPFLLISYCVHSQVGEKAVTVYTTACENDQRLQQVGIIQFKPMGQPFETQTCVFADPEHTFQSFIGIGGAITDASAETFYKLPIDKQQQIIRDYYDADNGNGYSLIRTNIHSCDFSGGSYTYVDSMDITLNSFSIDHDRKFRIPLIKQAMQQGGNEMLIYASPWSPPAWMKDNNNMLQGGKLLKQYYSNWAEYFVKFIKEYEKEGIPMWGVSIQNEPMARQTWESCIYTAEEEADFLKNYLGPVFERQGLADKKIIMWDHNRDLIYQRVSSYFADPVVKKYAWGIGFHWYEDWSGGEDMYENVRRVYETWPDKPLLFTEGTAESFDASRYYAWELGEEYGRSMIHDFNSGAVGWTDWNILLDQFGGPNHVGNFCFAPIHANTETGEVIHTNSFYYIGHFSRFIKPGAKRMAVSSSRSNLLSTGFVNSDGSRVVVVMNETDKDTSFYLWVKGDAAMINSPAHSISTMVF